MDLKDLQKFGQAVWLDYIRRDLLGSGELARLVRDDGVRGVTTNPSIFEKAIADTALYDDALARLAATRDQPTASLYEQVTIEDIQHAADTLRPVYDATERRDGFISMEVSPYLAHDTAATLAEARRLWTQVDRENLMIKVPGTAEGIPAIQQLTAEGLNINITLLFSRAACTRVLDAYMSGLEALVAQGKPLDRVASVASMFVSRIDTSVTPKLEAQLATASGPAARALHGLVGKVAIANAKLAYQDWKQSCKTPRWEALAERGARVQRLLWASTSMKDKRFRDVLYVEELIGPDTVDTIPPATLDALRDHGSAANRLESGLDEARDVIAALARTGISLDDVTRELLDEGVALFSAAFDKVFASIDHKRQEGRAVARPATTPVIASHV